MSTPPTNILSIYSKLHRKRCIHSIGRREVETGENVGKWTHVTLLETALQTLCRTKTTGYQSLVNIADYDPESRMSREEMAKETMARRKRGHPLA
jgi:hypothetical protein